MEANPKGALNLNCDEWGDDVAIFTGEFSVEKDGRPAIENAAYIEKYRQGIQNFQMTPESFSKDYSVALHFRVDKVRAF